MSGFSDVWDFVFDHGFTRAGVIILIVILLCFIPFGFGED